VQQLYALCDFDLLQRYNVTLQKFVQRAKMHNAQIIQYRDKHGSLAQKKQNLQTLRQLWDKTLIINDTMSLVEFCDGLHIGQEDLLTIHQQPDQAIKTIRQMIGKKILGLSTHNAEEITLANRLDLDYIGLGAYRTTRTKDVTNTLGDSVEELAQLSQHDVAIIGGVRLDDEFKHIRYAVVGSALYEG
jgi:thiamine-phosphate pyrophosphorylase